MLATIMMIGLFTACSDDEFENAVKSAPPFVDKDFVLTLANAARFFRENKDLTSNLEGLPKSVSSSPDELKPLKPSKKKPTSAPDPNQLNLF